MTFYITQHLQLNCGKKEEKGNEVPSIFVMLIENTYLVLGGLYNSRFCFAFPCLMH